MSGDSIRLEGLRVRGFHGVFEFEKRQGQDFVVDVELFRDLSAPAASDDLADTADYGALADVLAGIVAGEPFDLIEALAGSLVEACLQYAPEAEVTVRKPQAPIAHDFADVSVTLRRKRLQGPHGSRAVPEPEARAVISLGANLGDAPAALQDAVHALSLHPRIQVEAGSRIYVTAPVGGVEQPCFHNAAVRVRTSLPPRELLAVCQGIEAAAGRTREVRWGPRTLDLDLISARTAGGTALTWSDSVLELPHPRAGERAFVLGPWAELEPNASVPTRERPRTVSEAFAELAALQEIRPTSQRVTAEGSAPSGREELRSP